MFSCKICKIFKSIYFIFKLKILVDKVFCKCQNLNSLFRETNFLLLPKYCRNLQMLSIIKSVDTPNGKIGATLARWHVYWHAGTLARCHVKMRNCHAFGTLARRHVGHAGTYSTHGTRFSKPLKNSF